MHAASPENQPASEGFSAYVHVPFCAVRCGYCDFNTYTNLSFGPGANADEYADTLAREIELSAEHLAGRPLRTVFFGGGTPTLLPVADLATTLNRLTNTFDFSGGEITTEANPESVNYESLAALRDAGFTRISFGMQSAVPHVLKTLDRQHTPGQVERVVEWARALGLRYSLDLIYGAPGETADNWNTSLAAAIALEPEHISAYGLTIEPGTKMGTQLRRGEIPEPDPDVLADRYTMADEALSAAGYTWYEVSNWAKPGAECQHNMHYWKNDDWWGYGPGAHSHLAGTRFWNVKHPIAYAAQLSSGKLPIAEKEVLTAAQRRDEDIMLGIRLRDGIPIPAGTSAETVAGLIGDGLVSPEAAFAGHLVLTRQGRLLADTVIRELW